MEWSSILAPRRQITKQDRIRQIPAFGGLSSRAVNEIATISEIVRVPAGEAIYHQSHTGYELCIILEGQARVERDGRTINRLAKFDLWGELSMVDREPHVGSVIAETPALVLIVESKYFDYLLEMVPGLWKTISITLCRYVRGLCGVLDDERKLTQASGTRLGEDFLSATAWRI